MLESFIECSSHLKDDEYFCHFCNVSCPQRSAQSLASDLFTCPSCDVSYEVHSDDLLHKMIFQRNIYNKIFQMHLDYSDNKIKIYRCNKNGDHILPELTIDQMTNITPENVIEKLKTMIVFI